MTKKLTRAIDVTNIGQSYDYLEVIKGTAKKGSPIKENDPLKNEDIHSKNNSKSHTSPSSPPRQTLNGIARAAHNKYLKTQKERTESRGISEMTHNKSDTISR